MRIQSPSRIKGYCVRDNVAAEMGGWSQSGGLIKKIFRTMETRCHRLNCVPSKDVEVLVPVNVILLGNKVFANDQVKKRSLG